jgi:hypothetical protein
LNRRSQDFTGRATILEQLVSMQGAIAAGLADVTGAFYARRRAQCESAGDGHHQRPPSTPLLFSKNRDGQRRRIAA